MPYKTILVSLIVLWSLSLFAGCGYHFHADGKPEGVNIPSLAIPLMESSSSTLGFESDFTRVIREEFISHANVPLVPREEAAMVLIGKISEIRSEPLTYDMTEMIVQGDKTYYEVTDSRRLRVRLDAQLVESGTGKIIWKEDGMEEKARYWVTSDPLTDRHNKKMAIEEIARRLVDRLYMKTMERF